MAGRPWALILDQRVQRALRLPGLGSHRHYATYLDLAHQAAAQLNTTPHAIEHALFTLGGVPLSAQQGRP
ncbi:hypothetical protein [Luteococcus sp.]|uniref:8-oxoguanine DNA glycosylase OGG fold protein n=1 Tax=Luteococcus sp. TaxID=1969402 RepID=UPI00373704C5